MIVVKRADNIESPDALIARLVQEYQVPLRRMCCIWLKDAALAEDAVQETFVKAWRAALSFLPRGVQRENLADAYCGACVLGYAAQLVVPPCGSQRASGAFARARRAL